MNSYRCFSAVGPESSSPPKHAPWLERLLDRASHLRGWKRFWFGVWIVRLRSFCYEPERHGLDVTVLAPAYLRCLESSPDFENWQIHFDPFIG